MMTNGQIISLIMALGKEQAIKYGCSGLTNVVSNVAGDGLIFTWADESKIEYKLTSKDIMRLSNFDKNNDGIIDMCESANFAKEANKSKDSDKLNGKQSNLYFQKDINNSDDITEGINNKFLKQSDKDKIDKIDGINKQVEINKDDINNIKADLSNKKDELVKMNSSDTSGYLEDKIDKSTIQIDNNRLIAKTLDGLDVNIEDLNMLQGVKSNIQDQINSITKGIDYDEINKQLEAYKNEINDLKKDLSSKKDELEVVITNATNINDTLAGNIINGTSKIQEIDNKAKEVNTRLSEINTEEEKRVANEKVRSEEENKRETAENERIKNEKARQEEHKNIKNIVDNFSVLEEYSNTKNYMKYNRVTYGGSSYECLIDNTAEILPINRTNWTCIAMRGTDGKGSGDMLKEVYDSDDDGVIDSAKTVNGHTVESNVPPNAQFTDTIYDDTEIKNALNKKADIDENGKVSLEQLPSMDYIPNDEKGKTIATLINGKIPSSQLDLSAYGAGDMMKSVYDKDNDGIVDNAKLVNGHSVECDIPVDAKLTDTIYIHPSSHNADMIKYSNGKNAEEIKIDLESLLNNKVEKIEGKGLSSNDFADEYKEKLDKIQDSEGKVASVNGKIGEVVIKAEDIKSDSGETIEERLQNINTNLQERKTYVELKDMINNKQLIEGMQYVLTDYRTKYIQPTTEVLKEMSIEELVLTANSKNTFEPIVSSLKYPEDVVYYNFDDNICEDKTTPRNGFILRRYDPTSGNDAPQDWRSMLWARWTPHDTQYYLNNSLSSYSIWTSGAVQMGVLYKANNKLLMAKNTNVPTSATDTNVFYEVYCDMSIPLLIDDRTKIDRKIEIMRGTLTELKTFGTDCTNNTIKTGHKNLLHNNIFIYNCISNSFGANCRSNSFGTICSSNIFGNDCSSNIFGNGCILNSFGNCCLYNTFGNACHSNSFGSNCISNIFGTKCYSNSFGNEFSSNGFGANCKYNTFGNHCLFNRLINSCISNSFGNDCSSNSFGNECIGNSFGNKCYSNDLGSNFENVHVLELSKKDVSNISMIHDSKTNGTIMIKKAGDTYIYTLCRRTQSGFLEVATEIP